MEDRFLVLFCSFKVILKVKCQFQSQFDKNEIFTQTGIKTRLIPLLDGILTTKNISGLVLAIQGHPQGQTSISRSN